MSKLKLKSNLDGIEIGMGNTVRLKLGPEDTTEVDGDLLTELLKLDHFDVVEEGYFDIAEGAGDGVEE